MKKSKARYNETKIDYKYLIFEYYTPYICALVYVISIFLLLFGYILTKGGFIKW